MSYKRLRLAINHLQKHLKNTDIHAIEIIEYTKEFTKYLVTFVNWAGRTVGTIVTVREDGTVTSTEYF